MVILFTPVFGFSYGGINAVFPAIVGDYFGRRYAASVIGTIFTFAGPAAAIGPLFGGYIYDVTHDYRLSFLFGAFSNLLSLNIVFLARPPQSSIENTLSAR